MNLDIDGMEVAYTQLAIVKKNSIARNILTNETYRFQDPTQIRVYFTSPNPGQIHYVWFTDEKDQLFLIKANKIKLLGEKKEIEYSKALKNRYRHFSTKEN